MPGRPKRHVVTLCERSTCPTCKQPVTLLAREDGNGNMFFICWICREVRQAGVGLVKESA